MVQLGQEIPGLEEDTTAEMTMIAPVIGVVTLEGAEREGFIGTIPGTRDMV
jgi:hypothetical protein